MSRDYPQFKFPPYEPIKPSYNDNVLAWLGALMANHILISAVVILGSAFVAGVYTGRTW